MIEQKNIPYLRLPELLTLTKLSKSTLWRLEKSKKFPKRRQLSPNAVGWLSSEINEWLESRELADKGGK